nr:hypothetical protein [Tanacetum cinerariifolium]
MACAVPHSYDEIKTMVGKQIQEDRVRQLAMMNLAHEFNDASTAKDELGKAYEKCRDISLEQRDLIDFFKTEAELDYHMNNALLLKAAKLEKQIRDKTAWMLTSSNTTFEFDVNHNGEFKLNLLTYQYGSLLNIHILQIDFEDMNDYETNVMYDIAKVAGKLQIFVSHTPIYLSTVLIPNNASLAESLAAQYKLEIYIDHISVDFVISKYIFPNASLAEMMNHVITDYSSKNEGIIRQETQNDYTFDKMVEWAEQEHFEYKKTKVSCPKIDLSSVLIQNNSSKEESFGGIISEEQERQRQESLSYLHQMRKRKNKNKFNVNI